MSGARLPIDEEPGLEPVIGVIGKLHHPNLGMFGAIRSASCKAARTPTDTSSRASLQLADRACAARSTSNRPARLAGLEVGGDGDGGAAVHSHVLRAVGSTRGDSECETTIATTAVH